MTASDQKNTPLYNSRIVDTYLKLVKERYRQIDTAELLAAAGMRPYEVADQGHWFCREQVERFHARLTELTGNPEIAREAGRHAASPDALGIMRQYALGLLDPANVFTSLHRVTANFSRATACEARNLGHGQAEILVTPRAGVREQSFQCANRLGFFEAIPVLFRCRVKGIEHPECVFRGDACCRYVISWQRPSEPWKKARTLGFLLLGALCAAAFGLDPERAATAVLPLALSAALTINMIYERRLKREWKFNLSNFKLSTDKLLEQVEINYNNTLLANEIGQAISRQTNLDDILDNVVQVLEKRLDYSRGLILLANAERTALVFRAGFGYAGEELELLKKSDFHLDRPEARGIFVVSCREQRPFLVNDFSEIEPDLSLRSHLLAQKLGVKSFICCPIVSEGESVGILAADNLRAHRPLVQGDLTLLMGIASFIGISLHNAELLDGSARQARSILQTLASSIDARDPLTAGHSDKVTEYALGICDELGLPPDDRELIRVSAMLHDYGKIGVPDAILKKDDRLSPGEYEIVKAHAVKTREILEQIHFKGIFRQVPEIAGAHHEKIDGSGYPKGLKGQEIPLGAKIIAVADYFEAITAKRHYREPMPLEEAFAQMQAGSGRHFEPHLVEAFTRYFHRAYGDPQLRAAPARPHFERRRLRIPYRIPVALQVGDMAVSGTSADLSPYGIFVATPNETREGIPVEIAFPLPDERSAWVRARGRVAWVNSGREPKKPEFPAGIGVEFMEMGAGVVEAIGAIIGAGRPPDFVVAGCR